jgi:hypothetical protein
MDSDDVLALATQDAEKPKPPREEALGIIGQLAQKQVDLEKEIADLTEKLAAKNIELRRVSEQDLPEAMDFIGMKKFSLTSGFNIEVKAFYNAHISEDHKDDAFEWLGDNNHDDIIKSKVEVEFGKGELEQAKQFLDYVRGWNVKPLDPELKRTVHPQTLKSFVKGEVEHPGAAPLPHEIFGVFIGRKAKVKRS